MSAFLLPSEEQAERDRNELNYSAVCFVSRDGVVSGFEKGREWAEAKGYPKSRIESKIVFGLCTWDIALGAIDTSAGNQIGFCARSGKRKYQIE